MAGATTTRATTARPTTAATTGATMTGATMTAVTMATTATGATTTVAMTVAMTAVTTATATTTATTATMAATMTVAGGSAAPAPAQPARPTRLDDHRRRGVNVLELVVHGDRRPRALLRLRGRRGRLGRDALRRHHRRRARGAAPAVL